jgi:hypothetical protein
MMYKYKFTNSSFENEFLAQSSVENFLYDFQTQHEAITKLAR